MSKGLVRVIVAVILLGAGVRPAPAQTPPAKPGASTQKPAAPVEQATESVAKTVTFDHQDGKAKIFDLDLENREPFVVNIDNTCPAEFDYSYEGVERGLVPQSDDTKKKAKLSTHSMTVVFDDQFGGYVFSIKRKAGVEAGSKCEGSEDLQPASFIVGVREQEWGISFSGGFTFSGLTSPVFGIKTENNIKRIVEEPGKQDKMKLGAASFVHVFHDSVKIRGLQPALAFGLGINTDNKSEYFVGIGFRLGDKATINVGVAGGSITRLPNGVDSETPITDDNVLNNMGSRTVAKAFFALTYAFIDTKERFKKPFATDNAAAADTGKKEAPKDKGTSTGTAPSKIVETLVVVDDFGAAFAEFKGLKPCSVEVKPDGDTWAVTLRYDKLPKTDAAKVTVYLNEQMKKLDRKETLKPDVTFAACKP